jgi:hypothetical protein
VQQGVHMGIWNTHNRVRTVYWSHFQNLHNRSKKSLLNKKIGDLVYKETRLQISVKKICEELSSGEDPLVLKKLDQEKISSALYKLTYAEGAKALAKAIEKVVYP